MKTSWPGSLPAMMHLKDCRRGPISSMVRHIVIGLACWAICAPAMAQENQSFPKEQIAAGADLYAVNCSPCHGARMLDTGAAFNLRKCPPDQHERFINS